MEWLAGAVVRRAGIYRVTHRGHRPTHEALLQQGERFPACRKCGMAVGFEFVQPSPSVNPTKSSTWVRPRFMESVLPAYAQTA